VQCPAAPRPKLTPKSSPKACASLGFEAKLWLTADKLLNNGDGAKALAQARISSVLR
jgi:hypothetical protein